MINFVPRFNISKIHTYYIHTECRFYWYVISKPVHFFSFNYLNSVLAHIKSFMKNENPNTSHQTNFCKIEKNIMTSFTQENSQGGGGIFCKDVRWVVILSEGVWKSEIFCRVNLWIPKNVTCCINSFIVETSCFCLGMEN